MSNVFIGGAFTVCEWIFTSGEIIKCVAWGCAGTIFSLQRG